MCQEALFDYLGRRLGSKLLGRTDDTGQKLVKGFVKILNQEHSKEVPASLKLLDPFSQLVAETKKQQVWHKIIFFGVKGNDGEI
ncbi:hypothetical protein P3L10_026284 [Capsicum annuum]